jgi:hypothetical protein
VDRTFVYSSPASVASPASFGHVRLVENLDSEQLKPCGRALLPVTMTQSANYAWLYATACVSPTLERLGVRIDGKILDASSKVRKKTGGVLRRLEGSGITLWQGQWELFDLAAGTYTLELVALDRNNQVVTSRSVPLLHGKHDSPK